MSGINRAYGYGYDAANRLLFADFAQRAGSGGYADDGTIDFDVAMGDGADAAVGVPENRQL